MPHFEKGSQQAKDYMHFLRSKRNCCKQPIEGGSFVGGSFVGGKMPNLKNALKKKIWDKIDSKYQAPIKDIGQNVLHDVGFGLKGGSGGEHQIHHHHHHYYTQNGAMVEGDGIWDWANPKKNGLSKAFSPGGKVEKVSRRIARTAIPVVLGAVGSAAGNIIG